MDISNLFFLNTYAEQYNEVKEDTKSNTQTLILTASINSFYTINNWASNNPSYTPKFIQDATWENLDVNQVLYLSNKYTDYSSISGDILSNTQTLIFTAGIKSFRDLNDWALGNQTVYIPTVQEYLALTHPELVMVNVHSSYIYNASINIYTISDDAKSLDSPYCYPIIQIFLVI